MNNGGSSRLRVIIRIYLSCVIENAVQWFAMLWILIDIWFLDVVVPNGYSFEYFNSLRFVYVIIDTYDGNRTSTQICTIQR